MSTYARVTTPPMECNTKTLNDQIDRKEPEVTTGMLVTLQSDDHVFSMVGETQPNEQTVETTQFVDATHTSVSDESTNATQITDVEDTATIKDFLRRPTTLWNASLTVSNMKPLMAFGSLTGPAPQPFVKFFDLPKDLINSGKKLEKMNNFEWFSASMHFRVTVNVNPFVSGRLWACFAPYDQDKTAENQILNKTRASITSYPGVEIDLQCNDAAEFCVPWSGRGDAFSLTGPESPLGRLYIFALTPLMGQDSPVVPIQVMSWFDDVTLTGPTVFNVNLQSGEAKGPITEISGKVGKVAKTLSKVPLIGTIASQVGWAADIASGVASVFGWSRPVAGSAAQPFVNIPGRGMCQFKAEDQATVLAFANDNEIAESEPNFLVDEDEMAVEYVAKRPGMIASFDWAKNSDAVTEIGQVVACLGVDPFRVTTWEVNDKSFYVWDSTLGELVATHFGFWRADITFRISLVKTPFHVGRIEVLFVPAIKGVSGAKDVDATNTYRQIFDLKETNEIEFVVPYMHQMSMLPVGNSFESGYVIGTVVIRSFGPLSCPSTVSNNIKVNVWKHASNVTLACPTSVKVQAHLQGVVGNVPRNVKSVVFGTVNTPENNTRASKTVCGEQLLNLRVATRGHRDYYRTAGQFVVPVTINTSDKGYLGLCGGIYAFWRGGLSYKILGGGKTVESVLTVGTTVPNDNDMRHITFPAINPVHEVQVPFYQPFRRAVTNDTVRYDTDTVVMTVTSEGEEPIRIMKGGKDDLTFGYLIGGPVYGQEVGTPVYGQEVGPAVVDASLQTGDDITGSCVNTTKPFKVDTTICDAIKKAEEEKIPCLSNRGYYATWNNRRRKIAKQGVTHRDGPVLIRSTPAAGKHTVLYEVDLDVLRTLYPVYQCGEDAICEFIPPHALRSVRIFGKYCKINAKLQSIGDYNPFGLVADSRNAIKSIANTSDAVQSLMMQGTSLLQTLTDTFAQARITLFGMPVTGIVTKVMRVLVNALMSKRSMLLYNLMFNVSMEFGAEIYAKIQQMLGLNATAQFSCDVFKIEALKNFVCERQGLSAAGLGVILAIILQVCLGLPKTNSINDAVIFFGNRSRALTNIFSFGTVSVPLFTAVGAYLLNSCFGVKQTPELEEYLSGYQAWSEEVMSLLADPTCPLSVQMEKDSRVVFKVDKLYKQGVSYASLISQKNIKPDLTAHYHKIFKIVEEARKLCDYTGVFGNRPRVKPLVVQLFGESGVGKSGMSWPLSCDLNTAAAADLEQAKNFASEIYFRNTEQEFWDGYAGQTVVVYDDFGQRVDSSTNPNEEFMEMIRCANIAPYPLHMAELAEKKRTKFCSKFIILTSNVLNQSVSSLSFPDAYRRRIDVCAKVTNADEYTKSGYSNATQQAVMRLDPTKCDGPCDTNPYLMEMYDAESQTPIMKDGKVWTMNYDEFVAHCLAQAKVCFRNSEAVNKELDRRTDEARFQRLTAQLQYFSIKKSADGDFAGEGCVTSDEVEENISTRIMNTTSGVYAMCEDAILQFRESFNERFGEMLTLKNGLILAGVILAGIGAWQWMSSDSKKKSHHSHEAATSGDPNTKKTTVVRVEATTSGDPRTKQQTRTIMEAAVSGDPQTRRTTTTVMEHTVALPALAAGAALHKVVAEASVSGDSRTKALPKVRIESQTIDSELQVWKDASAQQLITNRVLTNMYKIIRVRGGVETPIVNGLFVRDRVMLAPRHTQLSFTEKDDEIVLENTFGSRFQLPYSVVKVVNILASDEIYHKDACLMQFPSYVNAHTDLVKHFQKMPEISVRRVDVCLPTIRSTGSQNYLTILGHASCSMITTELNTQVGTMHIRDALHYAMPTTAGDCGGPIICQETTMIRKIAGIHIAGANDGTVAIGQSVTQTDLLRTLEKMQNVIVTDNDNLPHLVLSKCELQLNQEYTHEQVRKELGSIAATFAFAGICERTVFSPNKTDIRPSLIHGVYPPTTKPSVLYHPDHNMAHLNLEKSALNTPYIPQKEVDKAVCEVRQKLLSNKNPALARVLTYEEAIAGSEDSTYMSSINRSSSPGYPWVLERPAGCPGKTGWFGDDQNFKFDPTVRKSVTERIDAARNGKRLPTIWTDTLKDERRPIEKVDALKTRVFANGPMDYTIAFRMYFLGFIAHIMENRIENEQSLGTNPFGIDWTKTAKKLKRKGNKVFAGDFSSFDGTLNSCIMSEFVKVANDFYNDGPENARIREVLFLDVYNSMHLCGEVYFGMTHSQPSGNPATTALNSFYNSVSMRIAYYRCNPNAPPFEECVSMVSYGDDNVVNFTDSVADWFNQETVTAAYATFGMIYTDEAKTGNLVKWRDLSEVAYLKRGFREDHGIWRAPMSLVTLRETPNWIRKCPDELGATQMNVEDVCMELAQHDETTFDQISKHLINTYYEKTGLYPLVYSYDSYNAEWNREMGLTL